VCVWSHQQVLVDTLYSSLRESRGEAHSQKFLIYISAVYFVGCSVIEGCRNR